MESVVLHMKHSQCIEELLQQHDYICRGGGGGGGGGGQYNWSLLEQMNTEWKVLFDILSTPTGLAAAASVFGWGVVNECCNMEVCSHLSCCNISHGGGWGGGGGFSITDLLQ